MPQTHCIPHPFNGLRVGHGAQIAPKRPLFNMRLEKISSRIVIVRRRSRPVKTSRRTLVTSGVVLLVGGLVRWQRDWIMTSYFLHRVRAVTVGLPRCDRVELVHLGGLQRSDEPALAPDRRFPVRPYNRFAPVRSSKTLSGSDAEMVAALWRAQTFGPEFQALCHHPAFGFRFYTGNDLTLETSVCFACANFSVDYLWESDFQGFDTSRPKARELYTRLQQLFPESIPATK